ncbi:unnamed protein product [Pleuronectes platessa]|uniref:Uncharacterized protein n=1 Tax=Pleuronectes platessa TaxID=8262 RepID=A0A9N7ZEN2_PLEPL|nr:unnamed protein product [Pleuronectes platessa]
MGGWTDESREVKGCRRGGDHLSPPPGRKLSCHLSPRHTNRGTSMWLQKLHGCNQSLLKPPQWLSGDITSITPLTVRTRREKAVIAASVNYNWSHVISICHSPPHSRHGHVS